MKEHGKGNQYAIAALKHRRAKLMGEVKSLLDQMEWKKRQLEHVDGALELFGATDPDAIRPVKAYKRVMLSAARQEAHDDAGSRARRDDGSGARRGGMARDVSARAWHAGLSRKKGPCGEGQRRSWGQVAAYGLMLGGLLGGVSIRRRGMRTIREHSQAWSRVS